MRKPRASGAFFLASAAGRRSAGRQSSIPSYKIGQKLGGTRIAIALDGTIPDRARELLDDRRRDLLDGRRRIVHAPSGPVATEPVTDVNILLEMIEKRKIEEGNPGGG